VSWPAPYKSSHREWKTLAGLERAIERYKGKLEGFRDDGLHVKWPETADGPGGTHIYPCTADPEGGTRVELQLFYDLTCP
jgi:hypothetical protein